MELSYDSVIPHLSIYSEKILCFNVYCITIYTDKTWIKLKFPSKYKLKKKRGCIYTMEYYISHKMNEIMPLATTWMDLEMIILGEVS